MPSVQSQNNAWLEKIENAQSAHSVKSMIKHPYESPVSTGPIQGFNPADVITTIQPGIGITPIQSFIQSPEDMIDEIRHANGNEKYKLLLDFNQRLDHMSSDDLKTARDYLVKQLASPHNKDDQFLGVLLNAVNQELDSREQHHYPHIIHHLENMRVD